MFLYSFTQFHVKGERRKGLGYNERVVVSDVPSAFECVPCHG
jgi:hypothetical protein